MTGKRGFVELRGGRRLETVRFEPSSAEVNATPLLLLPSMGGDATAWESFAGRLARNQPVLAVNPPGFGASSAPPFGFSTRTLAEDVKEFLDRMKIDRAIVLGVSFGGMIATWLAIDAPSGVDRLVLVSTPPRGLGARPAEIRDAARMARCLLADSEPQKCLAGEITAPDASASARRRVRRGARRHPWTRRKTWRYLMAALQHRPGERLGAIACPTLLIAGDQDPLVSWRSPGAWQSALSQVERAVISGAGHDPTLERPAETAARVLRFVVSTSRAPVALTR